MKVGVSFGRNVARAVGVSENADDGDREEKCGNTKLSPLPSLNVGRPNI
jgi:hypothetical protein